MNVRERKPREKANKSTGTDPKFLGNFVEMLKITTMSNKLEKQLLKTTVTVQKLKFVIISLLLVDKFAGN